MFIRASTEQKNLVHLFTATHCGDPHVLVESEEEADLVERGLFRRDFRLSGHFFCPLKPYFHTNHDGQEEFCSAGLFSCVFDAPPTDSAVNENLTFHLIFST
jgi:hypothetical protein